MFLVIGGGLMGCTVALNLAQRGAAVTVLERAVPGAEASSAAAGILGPRMEAHGREPLRGLAVESLQMYPAFAAEVERLSGMQVGFWPSGLGRFVPKGADAAALCPDPEAVWRTDLPPALSHAQGLWWLADEGSIDPPRLVLAVRAAAEALGAVFVTGVPVVAVEPQGIRLGDGQFLAGRPVVCAGAWTGLVPLPRPLPVRPVRGQVIEIAGPPGLLPGVIFHETGYLVPRRDGRVLVGATVEEAGFERSVTAGGVAHLLGIALGAAPALAGCALLRQWCNFRPGTPDDMPIVGDIEGIFVASGHYRNGILLAPLTGLRVVEALLEGRSPPESWLPQRFF